jgi:hypothetical protein
MVLLPSITSVPQRHQNRLLLEGKELDALRDACWPIHAEQSPGEARGELRDENPAVEEIGRSQRCPGFISVAISSPKRSCRGSALMGISENSRLCIEGYFRES